MALSTSVRPWTLRMPAGSLQEWTFTLTQDYPGSVTPWPISGMTWEYVARVQGTGDLLFQVDQTSSPSGLITVDAASGTVSLSVYPAATTDVDPGTYDHALWMEPGTTLAFAWLTGSLLIDATAQP